jgi:hypothetical protein
MIQDASFEFWKLVLVWNLVLGIWYLSDDSIFTRSLFSMRLHHLYKFSKEVLGIMRPWRSFGVVLHREDRESFVPHAFEGLVVEIDLGQFNLRRI